MEGPWLAQRVRAAGRVPEGCLGLAWSAAGAGRLYPAGEQVAPPPGGKLWWLRDAQIELRFAPQAACPHAGVALSLSIRRNWTAEIDANALGNWLNAQHAQQVTATAVQQWLQLPPHVAQVTPPPCAQADEVEQMRRDLNSVLWRQMGLTCLSLAVVALPPEAPGQAPAAPAMADEAMPAAAALAELRRLDVYNERRFSWELRALNNGLQRCEVAEPALQQDFWNLRQRASALHRSYGGLLPALPSQASPALAHHMLQTSRQATSGLDAAWQVLGGQDGPPATGATGGAPWAGSARGGAPRQRLSARDLRQLEGAVAQMAQALAARHRPWWECEA
ncbi:hypothetical protein CK623_04430 [Vandammella animalimorsus]|uniref:Uncharacterized protein n=1 Tax=Vandammella animalimorsus TaxID=2029117 RepID=A0A2A2ASK2_9BURK|nr:hypothetical protein CK623_04430 [Vandammella animalimorsus]